MNNSTIYGIFYIFAFRKYLLLILHFENRHFHPVKLNISVFFIGTESRKSRSQNLARFNLALKSDLARDLLYFRNPIFEELCIVCCM